MSAAKTRPLQTTATLDLGIDWGDAEPFQSQIARQVRQLVLSGRLKPGAKLPSSRALSEQLGVARATVVDAYEQLLGEGYLETRLGSGTTVAAELPETGDALWRAGVEFGPDRRRLIPSAAARPSVRTRTSTMIRSRRGGRVGRVPDSASSGSMGLLRRR